MHTNLENSQQKPSRAQLFTITFIGLLMIGLQPAHAGDEPFDAYETVREAGIGTNSPDYYHKYDDESADEHYVAPETPKSETIYLNNGKSVCFKLESDVSVAYYCNN